MNKDVLEFDSFYLYDKKAVEERISYLEAEVLKMKHLRYKEKQLQNLRFIGLTTLVSLMTILATILVVLGGI